MSRRRVVWSSGDEQGPAAAQIALPAGGDVLEVTHWHQLAAAALACERGYAVGRQPSGLLALAVSDLLEVELFVNGARLPEAHAVEQYRGHTLRFYSLTEVATDD